MYTPVYLQSGVEPGDETRVSFSRVQSLGFNPYTDFVVVPFKTCYLVTSNSARLVRRGEITDHFEQAIKVTLESFVPVQVAAAHLATLASHSGGCWIAQSDWPPERTANMCSGGSPIT